MNRMALIALNLCLLLIATVAPFPSKNHETSRSRSPDFTELVSFRDNKRERIPLHDAVVAPCWSFWVIETVISERSPMIITRRGRTKA